MEPITNFATKLTLESIGHILSRLSVTVTFNPEAAAFTRACLTTAYNGEDWYYVNLNLNAPFKVRYEDQIMNKAKLEELFNLGQQFDNGNIAILSKK